MFRQWASLAAMGTLLATGAAGGEAPASTNAAAAARTWHSASGTSIEATFVKLQAGDVHLQVAGGQTVVIALSRLTPEDQAAAKALAGAAASSTPGVPPRKQATWQTAAAKEAAKPPASKELIELFGDKLTNARHKNLDASELGGAEKIGIYFSAHWCPPCRAFTPKLVETYNALRKDGKPFEVVFVSADRDQDGMFGYMKDLDMPWLAIPYGSKNRQALMQKYKVSGIPHLVIIDATGKVRSENAVGEVGANGTAAYTRW